MITIEKLNIYNRYGGDVDCLQRGGNDHEKQLFANRDWSLINNFLQDIELISKKLTSEEYTKRTLEALEENCDKQSFKELTKKLQSY